MATNYSNQLLILDQLVDLCVGSGLDIALPKHRFFIVPGACGYSTGKLEKKGIPSIAFCGGPGGLRLYDQSVVRGKTVRMVKPVMKFMTVLPKIARSFIFGDPKKGKVLHQYATAFPSGLSMAQTWNTEIVERIGRGIQAELEQFGGAFWLAPALNIHRNPLCGRNYEYYSEDPMLSGKMAAAAVRGTQCKPGYGATIKHFCCNNQETNRRGVSENVSQRALREIYTRGFEIAVKESNPAALMTSYNKVNGVYTAESYDLCTKLLLCEWDYDGLIMTDWTTEKHMLRSGECMNAGVCLMMPGLSSDTKKIRRALRTGKLPPDSLRKNASKVLRCIMDSEVYQLMNQK